MPEITRCPQCQRQLRVPDNLIGQAVKCPGCGNTFTAVVADSAPPPPPSTPAYAPAPPPMPAAGGYAAPPQDWADNRGSDMGFDPGRRRGAPHRGTMILVFGILSLVLGCLGIIFGPMAWIMGNADLAEIRAGRMDREGEAMTNAGRICGMIGTILQLVAVSLVLLYFCCIFSIIGAGAGGGGGFR